MTAASARNPASMLRAMEATTALSASTRCLPRCRLGRLRRTPRSGPGRGQRLRGGPLSWSQPGTDLRVGFEADRRLGALPRVEPQVARGINLGCNNASECDASARRPGSLCKSRAATRFLPAPWGGASSWVSWRRAATPGRPPSWCQPGTDIRVDFEADRRLGALPRVAPP